MFGAVKGVFLKVDNEGFFPECARIIAEERRQARLRYEREQRRIRREQYIEAHKVELRAAGGVGVLLAVIIGANTIMGTYF